MTNYEIFESYWNEACNSTIYYLRNLDTPVIGRNKVNEIWRRELLENRFMCDKELIHGAKMFLDELTEKDPELGIEVAQLLDNSKFDIGCKSTDIAIGGSLGAMAAAVGALLSDSSSKKDKNSTSFGGVVAAVLGTGAAAVVVKSAYDGSKEAVINEFAKRSKKRLEAFKRILN